MPIKEVTQPIIPKVPVVKPIQKKIDYKYAGKESLREIIGKAIPKQLIPTKRIGAIFGGIFLLVIIIAGFQFPFSSLLSGNIDITIGIGYPWSFFEFELSESDTSPLKPANLLLDIFLYMVLAYAIDIALNLILKNPLLQSEKQIKQKPITFKDKAPSIREKVMEKVAGKIEQSNQVSKTPQNPSSPQNNQKSTTLT